LLQEEITLLFKNLAAHFEHGPRSYKSAALPTELRQPDPSFAADLAVVRNSHPDHLLEGGQL
jgi:hypothetical protein